MGKYTKKMTIDWENIKMEKSCYSITEVAKMYNITESTLRYWEKETRLSPRRSSQGGNRFYHKSHLILVDKLNYLINVKGLTIKAAKAQLDQPEIEHELRVLARLKAIRGQLAQLSQALDEVMNN